MSDPVTIPFNPKEVEGGGFYKKNGSMNPYYEDLCEKSSDLVAAFSRRFGNDDFAYKIIDHIEDLTSALESSMLRLEAYELHYASFLDAMQELADNLDL